MEDIKQDGNEKIQIRNAWENHKKLATQRSVGVRAT